MTFLSLGFFTGFSLILAIGAQNIFVIEQGLKKQFIFIVCLICALSDIILIFIGIFLFEYFKHYYSNIIELILNALLLIFLIYFIIGKLNFKYKETKLNINENKSSLKTVIFKTLGFTYLNPHVYSDTVFFLEIFQKIFISLINIYLEWEQHYHQLYSFFSLGYLSKLLSTQLNNQKSWKAINTFIILFMGL